VNIEKHTPIEVFYLPQTSTPVKLVEGNRWGVSRGHGKNTLGKLIMEQRQNLRVTSELPEAESVLSLTSETVSDTQAKERRE